MFNGDTPKSALTPNSDFFLLSEIATTWQIDSTIHKLKPRLFHKSTHLWDYLANFHPQYELCLIVELNNLWKAFHKSFSSIHGWPLNCMALVARRLLFLTQFMSFQGLHFLLAISSIFPSKKFCFVFLTIPLNLFQSPSCLDCLYVSKSLWQLLSYHALEFLVMFITLECLCHILSILLVNDWTMVLRVSTLSKESVLSLLME